MMKQQVIRFFALFLTMIFLLAGCATDEKPSATAEIEQTPSPTPVPTPSPVATAETEGFIVTEELYQQTFDDIEALIDRISSLVIRQDYNGWLKFLTADYIQYYSDADVLNKISIDLQKSTGYRVKLRTLRDYFKYVVVNSRIDVKLDKIEFLDENRIVAESIINDKPYILYYLEKKDDEWKIGKW